MYVYRIRPHHLLCVSFFRGKGYSAEFVENMERVAESLNGENPVITLKSSTDVICRFCPHNSEGLCDSEEKVARFDAAVLRLTGLNEGVRLNWSDAAKLVRSDIIDAGRLNEVCRDCGWYGICREFIEKNLKGARKKP